MGNSKNTETDLQWTKAATSLRANHFGRPRSVIAQRNKFKTNAMRHIHFQLTLTKWFFILVALLMFQIFNRKPLKIPTIAGGFNQRMCNYLKILRIINCVFHLESYFYQALNQLDFFYPISIETWNSSGNKTKPSCVIHVYWTYVYHEFSISVGIPE